MLREIAGIAHSVLDHGDTMLFVDAAGRLTTGQSGCRAIMKGGKTWLPQPLIDAFAVKGFKPATMADAKKAFVLSENPRGEDGKPSPLTPEQEKALSASFASQVVR